MFSLYLDTVCCCCWFVNRSCRTPLKKCLKFCLEWSDNTIRGKILSSKKCTSVFLFVFFFCKWSNRAQWPPTTILSTTKKFVSLSQHSKQPYLDPTSRIAQLTLKFVTHTYIYNESSQCLHKNLQLKQQYSICMNSYIETMSIDRSEDSNRDVCMCVSVRSCRRNNYILIIII